MKNWATAIRRTGDTDVTYYRGNDVRVECLPNITGDELMVYIGTYRTDMDTPERRQVVLAGEEPQRGLCSETFELVFRGPREMAIEIFEAHVGMLL